MNIKPDSRKIIKSHSVSSFVFFVFFLSFVSIQESHADSSGTTTSTQSFSNFMCTSGIGNVELIGQFTNGDAPYKVIFLKMLLFDKNGKIVATGNGNIPNIKAHETVTFNAITRFSGNFSSCTVQIDNAIEK